ncbi:MAG: PAS domain-containing protein [Myxococcales bacterium]
MTLVANTIRKVSAREAGLMVVSPAGAIRQANAAAHRTLGYDQGALIGLSLAWLVPPSRHDLLTKLDVALGRSTPLYVESVFMREDGTQLNVDLVLEARSGRRELSLTVEVEEEEVEPVRWLPQRYVLPVSDVAPKPTQRVDLGDHLSDCIQLLAWLDSHVKDATTEELARQRARVRAVLQDANGLLEDCRAELARTKIALRF